MLLIPLLQTMFKEITLQLDDGTHYVNVYAYVYLYVYRAKTDQEYKMKSLHILENGKGLCIFLTRAHSYQSVYSLVSSFAYQNARCHNYQILGTGFY